MTVVGRTHAHANEFALGRPHPLDLLPFNFYLLVDSSLCLLDLVGTTRGSLLEVWLQDLVPNVGLAVARREGIVLHVLLLGALGHQDGARDIRLITLLIRVVTLSSACSHSRFSRIEINHLLLLLVPGVHITPRIGLLSTPCHEIIAAIPASGSGSSPVFLEGDPAAALGLTSVARLPLVLVFDSCLVRQKDPRRPLLSLLLHRRHLTLSVRWWALLIALLLVVDTLVCLRRRLKV